MDDQDACVLSREGPGGKTRQYRLEVATGSYLVDSEDHTPDIRIFVDRNELDIGRAWQPAIFESLDRCRKVVAMLSPDYLDSKVCKEEFNIAWIRGRETDQDIIFPVYLYTAELPTYMKYRNYIDCREGSRTKLTEASRRLVAALGTTAQGPVLP